MIGNCRMGIGDLQAAEAHFRSAIAVDAQRAVAWKDLGAALDAQDRRKEAIEASATAVRLDEAQGVRSNSFVNLAIELAADGRLGEAIALHERMLPDRPFPYGHLAYAQALLKAGRLREGWEQYEFRFLCEPLLSARRDIQRPSWSGQQLQAKTILLVAEQGVGDLIQFIRYAPRFKELGATVVLSVPEGVEAFAGDFPGVDRVLERGAIEPDFDYVLHVVSLPHAFATDLSSVPADIPYVHADPELQSRWKSRLSASNSLDIGVVWAGNPNHAVDRHRSMPLAALAPLGDVAGARYFSLQKGARELEALTPPAGLAMTNLGPDLVDYRDTAAVISQLDLVISVDTSVAHLAGAMGKPVWLLLPKNAEWRWMEGGDDSPWYPTMRIFRQGREGEWADVIGRVRSALQARMRGKIEPLGIRPQGDVASRAAHRAHLSSVAHTRSGILQYLPDEPREGDSLRWYGEALQPQLDVLASLVRPGSTVLEVGAGVGAFAIPLAAMQQGVGRLLLSESRPVHHQILQQNLAAHRVSHATVVAAADVADALDKLNPEHLDLLKVNTGAMATVAVGAAEAALWRWRPTLFVTVPDDDSLREIAVRLRDFGYRCWRMETPWFDAGNFNRRTEDIFAGATALALVAIPEEIERPLAQSACVEI